MIVWPPELGRFLPRGPSPAPDPAPARLRNYWETLRPDGGIPERAALDPRDMAGMLDRVFLAERIGRGLVQVRVAGSALSDAAGMDLRGLPLSCLFRPEARPILAEVLEAVARGQVLAELDLSAGGGRPVARLVLLPLNDGPGRPLVLGCLGHEPGQAPAQKGYAILRRQEERIDPRPAAPPARPLRRAGHLTLVHSAE